MKVIELGPEHRDLFAVCLEDWSPEMREAGPRRACWIERFLERGLRARLVVDDAGAVGGMIQYLPIEASFVDGEGLYFIPCIWVHGSRQGRGNFQGRGMGEALLAAAEADARALGAKGMAAWGIWAPVWMRASWFRRHGYRKADRQGLAVLVWKPFTVGARPPRWFPKGRPPTERVPGKVTVTAYSNGWCAASNLTCARARRAGAEFGDRVAFRLIDTSERDTVAACGFSDAVFIDGEPVPAGPPPSLAKLRARIERRVRRLERAGPGAQRRRS